MIINISVIFLLLAVYCKRLSHPTFDCYKQSIQLGLCVSLCGDAALVWKLNLLLPGMILFVVVSMFYSKAFTFRPRGGSTGLIMILAGFTTFSFVMDSVSSKYVKLFVLVYTVAIMTMIWRAVVRWQNAPTMSNLYASFGGFSFGISVFLFALDKYQMNFSLTSLWVMLTYYFAQFFITLSVLQYDNVVSEFDYTRDKKRG